MVWVRGGETDPNIPEIFPITSSQFERSKNPSSLPQQQQNNTIKKKKDKRNTVMHPLSYPETDISLHRPNRHLYMVHGGDPVKQGQAAQATLHALEILST